jgi:hypothetical protein
MRECFSSGEDAMGAINATHDNLAFCPFITVRRGRAESGALDETKKPR